MTDDYHDRQNIHFIELADEYSAEFPEFAEILNRYDNSAYTYKDKYATWGSGWVWFNKEKYLGIIGEAFTDFKEPQIKPCKHYLRGHCKYENMRSKCKNHHIRPFCKFKKKCKRGDECRYRH